LGIGPEKTKVPREIGLIQFGPLLGNFGFQKFPKTFFGKPNWVHFLVIPNFREFHNFSKNQFPKFRRIPGGQRLGMTGSKVWNDRE